MKIKKNGKVISLTESDLKRIVKRVLNEQVEFTDTDYDVAVKFAKSVEDWWKGSGSWWNLKKNPEFIKFFTPFNSPDDDAAAAESYENKVIGDLNKEVGGGNDYYSEIVDWIDHIVEEIDDWVQSTDQTWLHLKSTDGRSSSYHVDPEIDV
jgi:hypothetical protein